jgi:hypothetical protein
MYSSRLAAYLRIYRTSHSLSHICSVSTMTSTLPTTKLKSTSQPIEGAAAQPALRLGSEEAIKGVANAMDSIRLSGSPSPMPNVELRSELGGKLAEKRVDKQTRKGGPGRTSPTSWRTNTRNEKSLSPTASGERRKGSSEIWKSNTRDEKVAPSPASGGIPDPTSHYLVTSSIPAQPLSTPQHLLVVIDLNGTLLYRPNRKNPTSFIRRPNTQPFLRYCIDTFTVVIWSSARPENVRNMCDAILSTNMRKKVAAIWGREKFDLTKVDYDSRVQCYKRLTKLWTDPAIVRAHPAYDQGGKWDQTNTVLVDDSLEKGRSEPFNLIEIPEFFGDENEQGGILPQVHDYLNHLAMHSNVSSVLRTAPFKTLLAGNRKI